MRVRQSEMLLKQSDSLGSARIVEQKQFDVAIGPFRVESLFQHPSSLVVALLLEAIVQLTLIAIDRRSRVRRFAGGGEHCLMQNIKNVGHLLLKKVFFVRTVRTYEAHMRRKDCSPSRQIPGLTEGVLGQCSQGAINQTQKTWF